MIIVENETEQKYVQFDIFHNKIVHDQVELVVLVVENH